MKENRHSVESESDKCAHDDFPVREPDMPLTPNAQAQVANKLPRAEQLNKFETHLEVHDSGNQPS